MMSLKRAFRLALLGATALGQVLPAQAQTITPTGVALATVAPTAFKPALTGGHFPAATDATGALQGSRIYRWMGQAFFDATACKVFVPTASTAGSPIADTDLGVGVTYMASIETTPVQSYTTTGTHPVFTFGGANTVHYSPSAPPSIGGFLSDAISIGTTIHKGDQVSIELAETSDQGLTLSSQNAFLESDYQGSFYGTTYEGNRTSTTIDYVANGTVANGNVGSGAASFTWGAPGVGATYALRPWLLCQTSATTPMVAIIDSDSIAQGNNEGGGFVPNMVGDVGYVEKYVHGRLGIGYVNLARGSSGFKFDYTTYNTRYRVAIAALFGATSAVLEDAHNDIASQTYALTLSEGQTAIQTLRTAIPGLRIVCTTAIPDTATVTGSLAALTGDQTASATGTALIAWNDNAIRGGALGCDKVIEAADAAATARDVSIFKGNFGTGLTAAISSSATSLTLASLPATFPGPGYTGQFQLYFPATGELVNTVASNAITGSATAGYTIALLTRGYSSTTAAAHSAGEIVMITHGITDEGTHGNKMGTGSDYIAANIASPNPFN